MRYILACLSLTGCVLCPEKPVPPPIIVKCIDVMPDKPNFVSTQALTQLDDYKFVLTLEKDRSDRMKYEAMLEALMEGCR